MRKHLILLLTLLSGLHTLTAQSVYAQEPQGVVTGIAERSVPAKEGGPYVCVGYNPDIDSWFRVGTWPAFEYPEACPSGYAYYSVMAPLGNPSSSGVMILGSCCRLLDDVLTDEHVLALEECPKDHVGTGGKTREYGRNETVPDDWTSADKYIRCTKVNTKRYQLGPPHPSLKLGWHRHFSNYSERRTTRSRIPLSIRYGIGRESRDKWSPATCVGYPWGSLLVRKEDKYCSKIFFSELQYRGLPGDPPMGTAVKLVPDCRELSSELDPQARCIN